MHGCAWIDDNDKSCLGSSSHRISASSSLVGKTWWRDAITISSDSRLRKDRVKNYVIIIFIIFLFIIFITDYHGWTRWYWCPLLNDVAAHCQIQLILNVMNTFALFCTMDIVIFVIESNTAGSDAAPGRCVLGTHVYLHFYIINSQISVLFVITYYCVHFLPHSLYAHTVLIVNTVKAIKLSSMPHFCPLDRSNLS